MNGSNVYVILVSWSVDFGNVFSNVGVYEIQQSASVAFSNFGLAHRAMAEEGRKFIINVGPVSTC